MTAHLVSADACSTPAADVLTRLGSAESGLTCDEAAARRAQLGPNSVRTHGVSGVRILMRQLNNAVLGLLAVTAVVSFFLGDRTQAMIIGIILAVSIGLGFVNEYRAQRATAALHSRIRHTATALRDNIMTEVDVTDLVPGDVIRLELGELVPADVRLLEVNGLECNESILTGESVAVQKATDVHPAAGGTDPANLAFMGTVVSAGDAIAVVYATGADAQFGRIAAGLSDREPETEFQQGLRRFSYLLLRVALTLTALIIVINLLLHRPLIESALFGLAIAVGITPQLLPAVVSTSLAAGTRRLAKLKVLVKRLVCIEDLGDIDILVTDKTGTLTEGRIELIDAVDGGGRHADEVLRLAMLATEVDPAVGGTSANELDAALWAGRATVRDARRVALLPFDHRRRTTTALVDDDSAGRIVVCKGAPEQIMAKCDGVTPSAQQVLAALFAEGRRVVAVATKPAPGLTKVSTADEVGLTFQGFVIFADRAKSAARQSLRDLSALGIEVKVATGDNPVVAQKICAELGLESGGTLTGPELAAMDAAELDRAVAQCTIFARVSPEQKARVISALRHRGRSVGFLGDGVNDALALHSADVGISVDSATDVAKDAADVVLLDKDLGVLAAGVAEGRRIFANTIKYVLMGTSSNFGNMFSAAAASAFLPFLPMLPSQVLLNNLLYDTSQLAIPTDRVDDEQLHAPSHWNIAFIRRFMLTFGPISSLFDFVTFGLMLGILQVGPVEFRTGWFVESLATQTLIIFAVRTRRVPFIRSRPSWPLTAAALTVIAAGIAVTISPLGHTLGFTPLPWQYFAALLGLAAAYLVLVEATKKVFYGESARDLTKRRVRGRAHRVHRRAARFSSPGPVTTADAAANR